MTANAQQREHWNADEAGHWVRYEESHNTMLEPFGLRLLGAAEISVGDRVLDIGCGTGWTTRQAAEAVGNTGVTLGVDLSAAMIERARVLANDAGLKWSQFTVADAQTDQFDSGPFDVAISRFGVMFFEDPVAAFANVHSQLRPGGRFCFVCWQELAANEWMLVPGIAVAEHVPLPDLGAPGAPGPFALSDPDRIRQLLRDAGFDSVDIQAFEIPVLLGGGLPLDETIEYLHTSGLGRAVLGDASAEAERRALAAMRAALAPFVTAEGVQLNGSAWLVTAGGGTMAR